MTVEHYENFPVASLLLPARLREPVAAIYAFARSADDIADEGDAPPQTRLRELARYRNELDRLRDGRAPTMPLFARLQRAITTHALPLEPFYDLLDAFSQDVVQTRYADFDALLDYCRRSANPIGRLLLHLYDAIDAENLRHADAICSALQLINFWQDVEIDYRKGRIYVPQDDMRRFGVDEAHFATRRIDDAWRALMHHEIDRASAMLESGAPLGRALPGRIGLELRMIVQGGRHVIEKLRARDGDIYAHRPVLATRDWPLMFWRAVRG